MTDHTAATVLIAALPGPLRTALHALLLSLPQVGSVDAAGDPQDILKTVSENLPGLVIVVIAKPQQRWKDLPASIRLAAPACRIAVLANGDTSPVGADLILQQGARPQELIAALEGLLEENKTYRSPPDRPGLPR